MGDFAIAQPILVTAHSRCLGSITTSDRTHLSTPKNGTTNPIDCDRRGPSLTPRRRSRLDVSGHSSLQVGVLAQSIPVTATIAGFRVGMVQAFERPDTVEVGEIQISPHSKRCAVARSQERKRLSPLHPTGISRKRTFRHPHTHGAHSLTLEAQFTSIHQIRPQVPTQVPNLRSPIVTSHDLRW